MSKIKYTDEELINYVKHFYKNSDKTPVALDFKDTNPNIDTLKRRFGDWNNVLALAGLSRDKFSDKCYTKQEMIDFLLRYYEVHNKVPTTRDLKSSKSYPSPQTYSNHFGSFKNALMEAELYDLRGDKHLFDRKVYSDEDLLKMCDKFIVKFKKQCGKLPTYNDINESTELPSASTYTTRFGSMSTVYKRLGYKIDEGVQKFINTMSQTDKQIIDNFIAVTNKHGRIAVNEFSKYGLPELNTYIYRFGVGNYRELLYSLGFSSYAKEIEVIDDEDVVGIFNTIYNDMGHVPTKSEIVRYTKKHNIKNIYPQINFRWGNYTNFLKSLNLQDKHKWRIRHSKDGSICRSTYEQLICDVLFDNKIIYKKDVYYKSFIPSFDKGYTVDYYLSHYNVHIEVFGIEGDEKYDNRIKEKQEIFKNNNLKLISIFPQDFKDNNYKMDGFILNKLD